MTKRKHELPIANVVMGIGLEVGADYGWNKTKETPVATVESDTEVLLNQREEERREMAPRSRRQLMKRQLRVYMENINDVLATNL